VDKRDVVIIGGGVVGLSIARELHRQGVNSITIVDKGVVGSEASWAAAGMLSPNIETDIGSPVHQFCRESLELYTKFAEELLDETGIDIELDRSGTIVLSMDDEDGNEVLGEYLKVRNAGFEIESWSNEDILKAEPHLSSVSQIANFYPQDWQVENRKIISALKAFAQNKAIDIMEHTAVSELIIEKSRVIGARTENRDFRAEHTILAAGAWSSLIRFGSVTPPFRIKPIRGQMIWFDRGGRLLDRVVYGPGCYLVPRRDGRILAGSTTEDVGFENTVTDSAVERLRNAAYRIFPELRRRKFGGSWSGLRPRSADELPVIGKVSGHEHLTVATGHYRNGILLAPVTAKIVAANLLDGVEFANAFSPDRFLKDSAASV
jgi:glycine oxidase